MLMSQQTDLSHLRVTCNLLDVPGSHLCALHLLCKLPDLACRNEIYINIIVLETNSSSLRKNQKMSL